MLISSAVTATTAIAVSTATRKYIRDFFASSLSSGMSAPCKNWILRRGCPLRMSYRVVTPRALQPFRFSVDNIPVDCLRDVLVTVPAGGLGHLVVQVRDTDVVG